MEAQQNLPDQPAYARIIGNAIQLALYQIMQDFADTGETIVVRKGGQIVEIPAQEVIDVRSKGD